MECAFDENTLSSIKENLKLLYQTSAGTFPGDREYGINMDFLDMPIDTAQNMYALEIIEKTEMYEKRVTVDSVTFESEDNKLKPKVNLTENEELDEVEEE